MRPLLICIILVAILAGCFSVWLSPFVFGNDGVTPPPEPTKGTIVPFPFPPIAPQAGKVYVPLVFGGNPCSEDLFYWCGTAH